MEESKDDQNSVSYGNDSDGKRKSEYLIFVSLDYRNSCLKIKFEGNSQEQNLIISKELLTMYDLKS